MAYLGVLPSRVASPLELVLPLEVPPLEVPPLEVEPPLEVAPLVISLELPVAQA